MRLSCNINLFVNAREGDPTLEEFTFRYKITLDIKTLDCVTGSTSYLYKT